MSGMLVPMVNEDTWTRILPSWTSVEEPVFAAAKKRAWIFAPTSRRAQ